MKPYFFNPIFLGKVQNIIEDWLQQDIIEKSTSLYSSPAFLTNRDRLVINYSAVNKLIELIDYPLGNLKNYSQYLAKGPPILQNLCCYWTRVPVVFILL